MASTDAPAVPPAAAPPPGAEGAPMEVEATPAPVPDAPSPAAPAPAPQCAAAEPAAADTAAAAASGAEPAAPSAAAAASADADVSMEESAPASGEQQTPGKLSRSARKRLNKANRRESDAKRKREEDEEMDEDGAPDASPPAAKRHKEQHLVDLKTDLNLLTLRLVRELFQGVVRATPIDHLNKARVQFESEDAMKFAINSGDAQWKGLAVRAVAPIQPRHQQPFAAGECLVLFGAKADALVNLIVQQLYPGALKITAASLDGNLQVPFATSAEASSAIAAGPQRLLDNVVVLPCAHVVQPAPKPSAKGHGKGRPGGPGASAEKGTPAAQGQ
eukprot:EG_transcript_19017